MRLRANLNLEVLAVGVEQEEVDHFVVVQEWERTFRPSGSAVVVKWGVHRQNEAVVFDRDFQVDRVFRRQKFAVPVVRYLERAYPTFNRNPFGYK